MLTRITGVLTRVLDEQIRLQVGPLEYEVLVPESVRRQLQSRNDQEITLHTSHYLEGSAMQGRMVPRLVGFLSEAELDFFDLFCTVDKVGVRKALRALVQPIRDIADAIQRQDAKWLTTLPGIGPATAEQVIATLRRKVAKFALMKPLEAGQSHAPDAAAPDLVEDVFQGLVSIGHSAAEARALLEKVLASGKKFTSTEDFFVAIYQAR